MSTKADVSGECSSLILLIGKWFIIISENGNSKVFGRTLEYVACQNKEVSGQKKSPSFDIIDSRSVKTSHHVETDRDIDWNKKIKEEKRAYRC